MTYLMIALVAGNIFVILQRALHLINQSSDSSSVLTSILHRIKYSTSGLHSTPTLSQWEIDKLKTYQECTTSLQRMLVLTILFSVMMVMILLSMNFY